MASLQILLPDYVLPVRPDNVCLGDHAVIVSGGLVEAVLPRERALADYPTAARVDLPGHALLPGLINMHTHSPMTLLRGLADDLRLNAWLKEHIWPAEGRWVGRDFVSHGTELAMAEMLRAGTTCFNEMYFFPDAIAETVRAAGMRAAIGMPVIDLKTPWASDAHQCLARAREVHASLQGAERLSVTLAPHALYTVGDEALAELAELANELELPVCMHVLEIAWEIEHSRTTYQRRPLQRLHGHGLLGERFQGVHMAHLDTEDVDLLAETGTHVIHCPESNLKLASGVCPVADLLAAGVNVSVGTDGAASNNNLDLLGELRTAALLAKGTSGDPCVLNAGTALELVTINAARAMGLGDAIGSIEPGKRADFCAIDLDQPETQPLHNVLSQIVYAASNRQITDVWVDGERLLEKGELTTIDLQRVAARSRDWRERLRELAA